MWGWRKKSSRSVPDPALATSRRRSQRLPFLCHQNREEFCRLCRTCIPRHAMQLPRRLHKHLPRSISFLRPVSDLRPDLPFQHINNRDPRMSVWRRRSTRLIINLPHGHSPVLHIHIRQIVFEHRRIDLRQQRLRKNRRAAAQQNSAIQHTGRIVQN